jgi:hypothetical protein
MNSTKWNMWYSRILILKEYKHNDEIKQINPNGAESFLKKLDKEFPGFYGTQRFITVFTRGRPWPYVTF